VLPLLEKKVLGCWGVGVFKWWDVGVLGALLQKEEAFFFNLNTPTRQYVNTFPSRIVSFHASLHYDGAKHIQHLNSND
jgi:hypothetical protein